MTTFRKLRLKLGNVYGYYDAKVCALIDDQTGEYIDGVAGIDKLEFSDNGLMVAHVRILVSAIELKHESRGGDK